MEAASFDIYTDRLRASLESFREVVGLVTLGSTADPTFRDEWSDHDFWVITEPGAQDSFVNDLSWLPDAHDIAITVCHAKHRRTVVYHNRHKVEFAIFDADDAPTGKIDRYRVLINRKQIAELIETIHLATFEQSKAAEERTNSLQNLCVLVWTACERFMRGELLSARQYVDGFAVNQLLSLLSVSGDEPVEDAEDSLDPRRRLELRSPVLAAEVLSLLNEPVPETALHLLEIAERDLRPKAPGLPWDNVSMVQGWIRELIKNGKAE